MTKATVHSVTLTRDVGDRELEHTYVEVDDDLMVKADKAHLSDGGTTSVGAVFMRLGVDGEDPVVIHVHPTGDPGRVHGVLAQAAERLQLAADWLLEARGAHGRPE